MSLASPPNPPQQPHQHSESSPSGPRGDGKVSVLSTNQRTLSDIANPACPGPPPPPDSSAHTGPQGWKRLISSPLTTHERISLTTNILSNRGEVKMARNLCRDDSQSFVDVIYEACSHVLPSPKSKLADLDSNFQIQSTSWRSDVGWP